MEVTKDFCDLKLFAKLMVMPHHILFNAATAAIAEAIRMWISAEQVQALHRVAPRYLELITSSNLWPFMLISNTLMSFIPWVVTFLYSVLFPQPFPL